MRVYSEQINLHLSLFACVISLWNWQLQIMPCVFECKGQPLILVESQKSENVFIGCERLPLCRNGATGTSSLANIQKTKLCVFR